MSTKTKVCLKCKVNRRVASYDAYSRSSDGLKSICIKCTKDNDKRKAVVKKWKERMDLKDLDKERRLGAIEGL